MRGDKKRQLYLGWAERLCAHWSNIIWGSVLAGVVMAVFTPAVASPWGKDPASLLTIQRVDSFRAAQSDRLFEQNTVQFYGEYGLSEKLTIGGKLTQGWQTISRDGSPTDTRKGIVDAEFFVQRQLYNQGRRAMAAQVLYAPATQTQSPLTGGIISRDKSAQFSLLYGVSGENSFVASSIGYRHSSGIDTDQIRTQITYGRHFGKTIILLEGFNTESLGHAGLGGQNYDLTSLVPSLVIPLREHYKLQLGASIDLAGEGLDLGHGIFIAVWIEQ